MWDRVGDGGLIKLKRYDALTVHSESKTISSQRRYGTGTPRARDQEKDLNALGEEIERKVWIEVEKQGKRSRSWPYRKEWGKCLSDPYSAKG